MSGGIRQSHSVLETRPVGCAWRSGSAQAADAELEEAFDQLQEEREITVTMSNESRERCVELFAELGKKIDRIAAYLLTQQRKASIAGEEAHRLQQRRRSAEQRVDDVKQMLNLLHALPRTEAT